MNQYSYKQESKNQVRHTVIRNAVELLTIHRSEACCVRNSYVRDVYDYFKNLSESHEQQEVSKIDLSYIREWERMHANSIGYKRPDELSVCYLSGPEPENDFNEFVSLGVLPNNIWAFECEASTYLQALSSVNGCSYMQPKIIKASIEQFFESSPKTFDIVYIDACASLISKHHALRCVASLFQHHRLNSPGVLITNFAFIDIDSSYDKNQFIDLISRYNFFRTARSAKLVYDNGNICFNEKLNSIKEKVKSNLESAYGDFVTMMICNAASITTPALRFCNSNYLQTLSQTLPVRDGSFKIDEINTIKDNTIYSFFASNAFLEQKSVSYPGISKINKLLLELSGKQQSFNLLFSLKKIYDIRAGSDELQSNLKEVINYFDTNREFYQFLDKPNRALFFDSVINQLSYPMHYVTNKSSRLTYVAKEKRMFTDMILFDECRYIYDWIPAIHQISKAFSNPSWQYTFRFGLDGLIKQRINYNNEYFFQGSVISKAIPGFEAQYFSDRIKIN